MTETLWTIQNEAAFEKFQKTGVLRADPNPLLFGGEYRDAYNWMAGQMRSRIGAAPEGVQYPVWAWYQWEGKRKRRDLRHSGYAKKGTPLVQITFEANPDDFLLSDFDGWHFVPTILRTMSRIGIAFMHMVEIAGRLKLPHRGIRFLT